MSMAGYDLSSEFSDLISEEITSEDKKCNILDYNIKTYHTRGPEENTIYFKGHICATGPTGPQNRAGPKGDRGIDGHTGPTGPEGKCQNFNKESIIIVNNNYQIKPEDNYIVINSVIPRIITLYILETPNYTIESSKIIRYNNSPPVPINVAIPTHSISIRSTATCGSHKIIVANQQNNINLTMSSYSLSSHQSVTLVPVSQTWFTF